MRGSSQLSSGSSQLSTARALLSVSTLKRRSLPAARGNTEKMALTSGDCSSAKPTLDATGKRSKLTGKAKGTLTYRTKFNREWTKFYFFIVSVKGDVYKLFCTLCQRKIACDHQGKHDM